MKILVTGANGFLGRGVVKQLLDDGMEVIATDLSTDLVDKRAKHDADIHMIILNSQMLFCTWHGVMDLYIIQITISLIYLNIMVFY